MKSKVLLIAGCFLLFVGTGCKKRLASSPTDPISVEVEEPTTWVSLGMPSAMDSITRSALTLGQDDTPIVATHDGTSGVPAAISVNQWVSGTTWTSLGSPGIGSDAIHLATDPADKKPLIGFCDPSNNNYPTVRKWTSGTTWSTLGAINTTACFQVAICVDSASIPTVLILNRVTYQIESYRYVGGVWTSSGVVLAASGGQPWLAIGADDLPVAGFSNASNRPQAAKWVSGTTWTDLGQAVTSGSFGYVRLKLDGSGRAVMSWGDGSGSLAYVARWNTGTTWTSLGDSGVSQYRQAPLAISLKDDLPYLLYKDFVDTFPYLKKSNGTVFSDVGTNPFRSVITFSDSQQMMMDSGNNLVLFIRSSSIGDGLVWRYE